MLREQIKAAVNRGVEATVHAASITHAGWKGTGYIITDPKTGAGDYKISGGADGGFATGLVYATGIAIVFIGGAGPYFIKTPALVFASEPIIAALVVTLKVLLIAAISSTILSNDFTALDAFLLSLMGLWPP